MASFVKNVRTVASRFQVLIITLLVLGGFFLYYYTVILYNNESRIKERSYRGLSLMAENINNQINVTLEKNAINFLHDLKKASEKSINISYVEENYNLKKIPSDWNITDSSDDITPGGIFISTSGSQLRLNFVLEFKKMRDTVFADAFSFFQPLLRKDLFNKYFLFADTQLVFKNIDGSFESGILDSLKSENALHNGRSLQVIAGGESFQMFSVSFRVLNKTWRLGGLMPSNDFKQEKLQIPGNLIVTLIFIFFLCFLLFPFLKCFLMNKEEHLDSRDVIFAFFSYFLIAATLTTAALNFYTYHALYRNGRDRQLKELGRQINHSLGKEVNLVLDQLKLASMEFSDNSSRDYYNIRKKIAQKDYYNDVVKTDEKDKNQIKEFIYPFTKYIVWVDSFGMQKVRWTKNIFSPEKINVKDRLYFKNTLQQNLWRDSSGNTFFLDAVKSWVSKEVLGVISMPSPNQLVSKQITKDSTSEKSIPHLSYTDTLLPVMYISGKFQSVFNPVLPEGFGFAVLNEQGKVYFHSNREFDLYENFLRETGNNSLLSSTLHTRIAEFFTDYYYGRKYRFYVKPVTNMPLFVVTFSEVKQLSENNTSLLSALSVFIFIQAILIILSAILIQAFRAHYSRFGVKMYNLSWLTPREKYLPVYEQHIWLYILMALTEIFLAKPFWILINGEIDTTLFIPGIILTYSILSVGFSYYLIRVHHTSGEPDSISQDKNTLGGITTLYFFIFSLFFINLIRQNILTGINFLLLQFLPFLFLKNINTITRTCNENVNKLLNALQFRYKKLFNKSVVFNDGIKSYKSAYISALLSFALLNSVIAITKIYQLGYNQETTLLMKSQQLQLAKSFWSNNDSITLDNDKLIGKYYKNIVADSITYPYQPDTTPLPVTHSRGFAFFYRKIRPAYREFARSLETYNSNSSDDSTFRWRQHKNKLTLYADNNSTLLHAAKLNHISISGTLKPLTFPGFNLFPGMHGKEGFSSLVIAFYISMVLIILGLYLLIREFLKRVMFPLVEKEDLNQRELLENILHDPRNRHLMIVGLPDCGKINAVNTILKNKKNPETEIVVESIDMTNPGDIPRRIKELAVKMPALEEGIRTNRKNYVFVRNFEYCFTNPEITKTKLETLEQLLRMKQLHIILFSTTQSLPFIDEYFEIIKNEPDASGEKALKARINAERWINVMDNFPVFYYRWDEENNNEPGIKDEKFLTGETRYSDFLYSLRPRFQYEFNNRSSKKSDLIQAEDEMEIKINQAAINYFDSVWMSLTLSERKVLYDFAKDQLVNHHKYHEMSILLQKGLFQYEDDELKLMSRSFRNYILNRLKGDELIKLQAEESQKGSWNKMRSALIVIIILVGIFLFITQQEALNSLVAYLSAFSGGIFALLNLVNKIPAGSK